MGGDQVNLSRAKRRWKAWLWSAFNDFLVEAQKPARKQFANGMVIGIRSGEWWIGARPNFATDSVEIGLLGLTWIIPEEFWWNKRTKRAPMSDDDDKLTWRERWYALRVWLIWFHPRGFMRRSRKLWNRRVKRRQFCLYDWCFRWTLLSDFACPKHRALADANRSKVKLANDSQPDTYVEILEQP